MKLLADLFALVSLRFLAPPAWHLNHYAWLASRLTLTRIRIADPEMAEHHRQLLQQVQKVRDEWRPWKAICLHIGTAAGLLAALLTVIVSAHESWVARPH